MGGALNKNTIKITVKMAFITWVVVTFAQWWHNVKPTRFVYVHYHKNWLLSTVMTAFLTLSNWELQWVFTLWTRFITNMFFLIILGGNGNYFTFVAASYRGETRDFWIDAPSRGAFLSLISLLNISFGSFYVRSGLLFHNSCKNV